MHKYILLPILGAILLCSNVALAQDNLWTSARPDGHAPIGVMGDHTHGKGELMFSYRYMYMDMEDMRDGTETLTNEEVLSNFMVTPLTMPMHMHMFGVMYAASDKLTLMGMLNLVRLEMDHLTRMGGTFTTESGGLADIRISGLYKFFDTKSQRAHLNLGLSIPTNQIDEMDVTPASEPGETQLPYPMQVSSGTFDILPGITYLFQIDRTSLGAQVSGILRTGENDRNYRLGHQGQVTFWTAYQITNWLSTSIRLTGITRGEIDGEDETYAMAVMNNMVPTVSPENFGGNFFNVGGGINFYVPGGMFKDLRFGIEYEVPLVQDLNGPQMELQQTLTVGVQYAL